MPRTLHITLHHLYVCVLAGGGEAGAQPSLQCGLLRRGTTRLVLRNISCAIDSCRLELSVEKGWWTQEGWVRS